MKTNSHRWETLRNWQYSFEMWFRNSLLFRTKMLVFSTTRIGRKSDFFYYFMFLQGLVQCKRNTKYVCVNQNNSLNVDLLLRSSSPKSYGILVEWNGWKFANKLLILPNIRSGHNKNCIQSSDSFFT